MTEVALDGTELGQNVGINNTGKIFIVTTKGNVALTQDVHTSNGAADAIVLNAGQSASAGTAAGGNVSATEGVTVSTGSGGKAMIYTGSVTDSNGLADVVGYGSGNFRYNSDELQSNFGKPIGASGVYAVYREQPILVVSTNDKTN